MFTVKYISAKPVEKKVAKSAMESTRWYVYSQLKGNNSEKKYVTWKISYSIKL